MNYNEIDKFIKEMDKFLKDCEKKPKLKRPIVKTGGGSKLLDLKTQLKKGLKND